MDRWFTSDTHFGHENILKFTGDDGTLIRPGFADVTEMDEVLIERWNSVVKQRDVVYHLGDFIMGDRSRLTSIASRLNGRKRLIVGNHDDIPQLCASGVFEKVQLWCSFKDQGFLCSHIPLPWSQFRYKTVLNVHGHIHEKVGPTRNHLNLCVERTDYTPVHIDLITDRAKDLQE